MESKLIEVRPIKKEKWHNVDGKIDFARSTKLSVLIDGRTRKYATGLTEKDISYLQDELGFKEDISDSYIAKKECYWTSKASIIELKTVPFFLDTSIPHEYIKWKNILASNYVANSLKEYNDGLWPDATHIIFDEDDNIEEKATRAKNKKEAYKILAKLSKAQQVSIIKTIEGKDLSKNNNDFIDVELTEIIETKLDEFLKYSKMDKKELSIRALIFDCMELNILNKKGSAYYYMDDQLGHDFESTIDYLQDVKNQNLLALIKEKVQSKQ